MYKATKLDDVQLFNLKALIAEVKKHEERTVVLLGDALPLALNHVWGNENVTMINDLIHALSPINKKAALVFFAAMQPHSYDVTAKDKRVKAFGKRIDKATTIATKKAMERFFSLDEKGEVNPEEGYFGGDYWLWADSNITVKADVDYTKMFLNGFNSILDEDKGGMKQADLVRLMLDNGLEVGAFMEILKPNAVDNEIAELMQA